MPAKLSALTSRHLLDKLIRNDDLKGAADLGCATCALPGSPEKERVMEARVGAGLSPFHPDDARLEDADGIGIEPPEDPGNGSASKQCVDSPSGADPIRRRASRTDGKRVGDEHVIRAKLDGRRRARKEGR